MGKMTGFDSIAGFNLTSENFMSVRLGCQRINFFEDVTNSNCRMELLNDICWMELANVLRWIVQHKSKQKLPLVSARSTFSFPIL